jgi:response regulator of citrate/malate metabolism
MNALKEVQPRLGGGVTAGVVAGAMGQSRNTAKKYLKLLVVEGAAVASEHTLINGMVATYYSPVIVVRYKDDEQTA